jgi:hypothetical protein
MHHFGRVPIEDRLTVRQQICFRASRHLEQLDMHPFERSLPGCVDSQAETADSGRKPDVVRAQDSLRGARRISLRSRKRVSRDALTPAENPSATATKSPAAKLASS